MIRTRLPLERQGNQRYVATLSNILCMITFWIVLDDYCFICVVGFVTIKSGNPAYGEMIPIHQLFNDQSITFLSHVNRVTMYRAASLRRYNFMDFKYTQAGSKEQIHALEMFHSQVCMWCYYFCHSEKTQWSSFSTLETTAEFI